MGADALNRVHNIELKPKGVHLALAKKASDALPELDSDPKDLYEMLFSKEELLWLQNQYHARMRT
jgi:hypothetical protein